MRHPHDLERVVVLLDASGSMGAFHDRAVAAANEALREARRIAEEYQRECDGTLVFFRAEPVVVFENRDIGDIEQLHPQGYVTAGMTALYDAVATTLLRSEGDAAKVQRRRLVTCRIVTDGLDNASTRYSRNDVLQIIQEKHATGRWTFEYPLACPEEWVADGEPDPQWVADREPYPDMTPIPF